MMQFHCSVLADSRRRANFPAECANSGVHTWQMRQFFAVYRQHAACTDSVVGQRTDQQGGCGEPSTVHHTTERDRARAWREGLKTKGWSSLLLIGTHVFVGDLLLADRL